MKLNPNRIITKFISKIDGKYRAAILVSAVGAVANLGAISLILGSKYNTIDEYKNIKNIELSEEE